jgi:hypothetical protein
VGKGQGGMAGCDALAAHAVAGIQHRGKPFIPVLALLYGS